MSNIYVQEPPALGKVLLKTTVGDIDLELWTKEAPKACRNFMQLCMEGYYNGTIFHRLVPDFIVQGGDPKGDGTGGESVYGAPFKDEFHSRLRFNRRGLVAMANAGKDDNGSQFFFTLNATPELQNKHTIFGKVTGETIFNVLKLSEGLTDHDERPLYPHKIIGAEILVDPYEDIVPRVVQKTDEDTGKKKKRERTGVKNFGLLSFGMEAEEEEDQSTEFRGKPKSTHDLLDDPKLSRLTGEEVENEDGENSETSKEMDEATKAAINSIRDKLKAKNQKPTPNSSEESSKKEEKSDAAKSDDEIEEYYLGKDRVEARKKEAENIRGQIRDLKREMAGKKVVNLAAGDSKEPPAKEEKGTMVKQFEEELEKYRKMKEEVPNKGASRVLEDPLMQIGKKPWVKNLYENTGHYPDNYTDVRFLEQMRKNVNPQNVTFLQCLIGSFRVTQKVAMCVLFTVVFVYLYNEWTSIDVVLTASCSLTTFGYFLFLVVRLKRRKNSNEEILKNNTEDIKSNGNVRKEDGVVFDRYVEKMFENSVTKCINRKARKHNAKSYNDTAKYSPDDVKFRRFTSKPKTKVDVSIIMLIYGDLKTVLIFLVFGYIVSPILHTLTDTVSTDTIFAMTAIMMVVHLIFSDYGISAAIISNSLSINAAIFGSICLASRLSTPFHAFVLLTVAVQCFVLLPILVNIILDSNLFIVIFSVTILCAFVSLWRVSMTMFYFLVIAVVFMNVYCPLLFVRWQKYKDNIYGPWDEAIVHDSDDIEDCVGINNAAS